VKYVRVQVSLEARLKLLTKLNGWQRRQLKKVEQEKAKIKPIKLTWSDWVSSAKTSHVA